MSSQDSDPTGCSYTATVTLVPPGTKKWIITPAPTDRNVNHDRIRNSSNNGWLNASTSLVGTGHFAEKVTFGSFPPTFKVCTP